MENKAQICEDCHKSSAVIHYSEEPFLTLTHGWGGSWICRLCFIKRIKRHIQDCKEQLKEQNKLLKDEIK